MTPTTNQRKKVFVTGPTGMIGKQLVKAIEKKKKYDIVLFSHAWGKDITNKEQVAKEMRGANIVIHLAAIIDETVGEKELFRVNVEGTNNLLDVAEEGNVEQFIFLSSVGVFGNTKKTLSEEDEMNPQTPYEKSKAVAERNVWERQEVFPVTIIRPALVVGPNQYWKSIFNTVRKGFPLIGKGENAWQMVDVDDVVSFIMHSLENEDALNEVFVVAGAESPPLRQVVDWVADTQGKKHVGTMPKFVGVCVSYAFAIIGKVTGKKPLLIPAHVKRLFKHRSYSIKKARGMGWEPAYSTKESLEKTYKELFVEK